MTPGVEHHTAAVEDLVGGPLVGAELAAAGGGVLPPAEVGGGGQGVDYTASRRGQKLNLKNSPP